MTTTPKILVSRCYAETTPESADDGDHSDSGFVYESEPMTFSELVREIRGEGFNWCPGADWLLADCGCVDFSTGTHREETLHFAHGNEPHLRKWFNLAVRFALHR